MSHAPANEQEERSSPLDIRVDGTTYSERTQANRLRERNIGTDGRKVCVDCGAKEPPYGNANPHGVQNHHLIPRDDWRSEAESHHLLNMVPLCVRCHQKRWERSYFHIQLRAFQSHTGGMLNFRHAGWQWLDGYYRALQRAGYTCEKCGAAAEQVKYDVFPGSSDLTYEGLNVFPYLRTRPCLDDIRFRVSRGVANPGGIIDSINHPSRMMVLCDGCYYGGSAPYAHVTTPDQGGVMDVAPQLLDQTEGE